MNAMKWAVGAASVAVFLLAARAELPPTAYKEMQAEAGEALEIEITGVKVKAGKKEFSQVTAEARVLGVQRSKSGLKTGASIVIEYSVFDSARKERGWVGPSSPQVVKKGGRYSAFLKATAGKPYTIAAMGRSFVEAVKPARPSTVYLPQDGKEFRIKEEDVVRLTASSPASTGYSIEVQVTAGKATVTERRVFSVSKGKVNAQPGSGPLEFDVKPMPGYSGKITIRYTASPPGGGKPDVNEYTVVVVK